MPLYDYECQRCLRTFEFLQQRRDDHPTSCKLCGFFDVRRLVSVASFRLKGDGWYATDFKGS